MLLAGAGTVAVHHLGLNFLAAALVFPDGPNLWRVVLHAGCLIVEALTLVLLANRLVVLFVQSAKARAEAQAASDQLTAAIAERAANLAQRDVAHRLSLEQLAGSFHTSLGQLVGGLSEGAGRLGGTAGAMTELAGKTRQRSEGVARSADETRLGVETMANAAETLAASIQSSHEMSAHIAGIGEAATNADAAAGEVREAATELTRQAAQFTLEAQGFVASVRAA